MSVRRSGSWSANCAPWIGALVLALRLAAPAHPADAASGASAESAVAPPSLSRSTRDQLRMAVDTFNVRLKSFRTAYEQELLEITRNDSIQDPDSELDRIQARYAARFSEQFKPEGAALRDELLRRLDRPLTPAIREHAPLLESEQLADPDALSDLADYLARLATELP